MRGGGLWRAAALAAAVTAAVAAAVPAGAQDRFVVRTEPGTPVVALEVLVATGPADEPEGQAGVGYLAARSVLAPVLPALEAMGAHVEIHGHRDAVSFTVVAAPDVWREASRALLVALFRDPVDASAVTAQRREIAADLARRQVSPADEVARRVDAALYGPGHPWSRPVVGTAESVARLTPAQVDAHLRAHFIPMRAVVAAVGPVDYDAVATHLRLFLDPGPPHRATVAPARREAGPVRVQSNTITAWVAAAYPFGTDADVEALRMLAHLAVERVSFGALRPSVYDARAEVVRHGAGGEVRLQLVVPPTEAEVWAERLHGAVREFAREPLTEPVFAERLRRYGGARLLPLAAPEERARALARGALLGGAPDEAGARDLQALTPERLHAAARDLPDPVLVTLGPFVEEGDD
jgi:predicted Zn-dependent peptidase